jgi:hemolysin activation/secretion protein
MINRVKKSSPARLFGLFCLAANSWAAPPDAGSLLREEIRRDAPPAPFLPPTPEALEAGKPVSDSGAKTPVTAFRISGLASVPEADAQAFLAPFTGQSLSVEGLHRVAAKFEQWLKNRGLFTARAYVPPQEIKDGVVEIRVIEGRVGGIDIKRAPDTRLSDDKLHAMLESALPAGLALEEKRLERGLLLINDLPATSARAVLAPGEELGAARVIVEVAQGPIVSGSVEVDNFGNVYTGAWEGSAGLSINDAFGIGDQWNLRASASQGSSFVRGGYVLPLGSDGWKAGLTLIESRYRLCCGDATMSALHGNGNASSVSGFVSYPLIRTRLSNLSVSLNVAHQTFVNRALGVTTSDIDSNTLTLGLNGDYSRLTGIAGLGSYTSYSAQWVSGRVALDGWAANKLQDALSAQSQGGFDKASGQVFHLLRLSNTSALYAALSGQWASKNLDSSQKFVLGGPQGVRAYPTGEASGDEGWLLNLEWRREIDRNWRFVVFVDHGEIRLHRNTWSTWNAVTPRLDNQYGLSGFGASAVWTPTVNSQISATLAQRLGNNPARAPNGDDSDGRPAQPQLWIQVSAAF